MKRVVVVTPFLKAGGGPPGYSYNLWKGYSTTEAPSKYKLSFASLLFEGRHAVVGTSGSKAKGDREADGIVRRLKASRLWKVARLCKTGTRNFRWNAQIRGADLVVFQGYQETKFLDVAIGAGRKIVYMPHSPSIMADEIRMFRTAAGTECTDNEYAAYLETERSFFKAADWVVFPSPGASEEYRKAFHAELRVCKTAYIASGISPSDQAKDTPPLEEGFVVLFAGRYVSHKGYDLFCEAADLLASKEEAITFCSVGGGDAVRGANVVDLGWRDDIYTYLKAADLIAVPNRVAYYDLLPLECAYLGKPMVMTQVGGNVDQLAELPDTIPISNVSAQALATAVLQARSKIFAEGDFGAKNAEAYAKYFNAQAFWGRWDAFLQGALETVA